MDNTLLDGNEENDPHLKITLQNDSQQNDSNKNDTLQSVIHKNDT
jgi:hypothetical protein